MFVSPGKCTAKTVSSLAQILIKSTYLINAYIMCATSRILTRQKPAEGNVKIQIKFSRECLKDIGRILTILFSVVVGHFSDFQKVNEATFPDL